MAEDRFVFGQPESEKQRSFPLLRVTLLILLVTVAPLAFKGWNDFYNRFGEKVPPIIKITSMPAGIGIERQEIRFVIKDDQSGVDEVKVRSEQRNQVTTLLRKTFPSKTTEEQLSVVLNGKESGYDEGKVTIHIVAFDRSFWSNSSETSFDLDVSYERPSVEMITAQHNAVHGGVELAFYTVKARDEVFSGVTAAAELFPGFRARKLDGDFENMNSTYFAFFAIPLAFKDSEQTVQVLVRNKIGNTATTSMYYRVAPLTMPTVEAEISPLMLETAAGSEFEKLSAIKKKRAGLVQEDDIPAADPTARFKAVNQELRAAVEADLKGIFMHPKAQRMWQGVFLRPQGRQLAVNFGATKVFTYQGEPLGHVVQQGVEFAMPEGNPIRAANDGIVILAADLPLYGQTVVIDHGFGLTSLYAHLSAIEHLEGTRVVSGQTIGASGSSGLLDRPLLEFQMRLHGVPVRPIEWWDSRWILEHIDAKIDETKKRLGIKVKRRLD